MLGKTNRFGARALCLTLCLGALVACTPKNPRLLNLSAPGPGPDEFSILPTKPLQSPESYDALPAPTPGMANRADATPQADAVAALGGNPAALASGGGARDAALISHTTRFGVTPGIRQTLAAADLEFRRRNDGRVLERLFDVNVYYRAYKKQELDQYRELERFRRAGVRTPAVPPKPQ
ncbi:DUF3035 domain-containing protein [Oceaniglobus indicus]|uniref:DUF3035 domain-containing protein n=1 Tax=Oceaniglobus indicus TaxID=2047749 RepID=UPI000C1752A0|nr:DUF3035 domain-containing protein [Oceaniglobus indicus]